MNRLISLPDPMVASEIGKFIRYHRLNQNQSQEELAAHSGVKRSTIVRIERGGSFNVVTMIQLLRSLGLLEGVMDTFKVPDIISPSLYIKAQRELRKRATQSKFKTQI